MSYFDDKPLGKAEDVRLDLVNRTQEHVSSQVGDGSKYFHVDSAGTPESPGTFSGKGVDELNRSVSDVYEKYNRVTFDMMDELKQYRERILK